MDQETERRIIRRAFAKQVTGAVGVTDPRIEDAFAAVRREDFLGPGPWQMVRHGAGYVPTAGDDPVYLYTDDLFGIVPERSLNNGQPRLHAALIAAAAPQAGEHVVHIGAGVGYYSAILAALSARVTAIEFDPDVAARLACNFAGDDRVQVVEGDGAVADFGPADVIYVNAGTTRPAAPWLDRLNDGGRLILPLTAGRHSMSANLPNPFPPNWLGAVFRIVRQGDDYLARAVSPVAIFPCAGARDPDSEQALAAAFETGGWRKVTRLHRQGDLPAERCWLRGADWCLAYD
jgi:protein-L-isoaspartate(D-aspartate) O-methyltransferase